MVIFYQYRLILLLAAAVCRVIPPHGLMENKMKFFFRILILLACAAAFPLAAAAQATPTQTVDLGNGYSIVVPAAWQVNRAQEGAFTFKSDTLSLTATTP